MKEETASLTVEAAFVTSLLILVLFSVILMTFYLRDAAVAAARVRQLEMERTVAVSGTEAAGTIHTLTTGTAAVSEGTASVRYEMAGLWPLGTLRGEETAKRMLTDPAERLRQAYGREAP